MKKASNLMNASFGCKGEIHLEVVEMFPSR